MSYRVMNEKTIEAESYERTSANLLDHDINLITILHVEILGGLGLVESLAIEEEAHVVDVELNGVLVTLCLWQ